MISSHNIFQFVKFIENEFDFNLLSDFMVENGFYARNKQTPTISAGKRIYVGKKTNQTKINAGEFQNNSSTCNWGMHEGQAIVDFCLHEVLFFGTLEQEDIGWA